ncbi:hypothetical protein [Haloglycomyces albus]|uniref:hypothetical protein n=1 Tax=Haloglycomyces albus TaxID=526067 RepID=UPI00046CC4BF|nr:hypothetical protein [Haloglycomyces albus]
MNDHISHGSSFGEPTANFDEIHERALFHLIEAERILRTRYTGWSGNRPTWGQRSLMRRAVKQIKRARTTLTQAQAMTPPPSGYGSDDQ